MAVLVWVCGKMPLIQKRKRVYFTRRFDSTDAFVPIISIVLSGPGQAPDRENMPALRLRRTLSQKLSGKTIDCGRPEQKMIEKATISYVKTDTKA